MHVVAFACFQSFLVVLIQRVYYFTDLGVTYFYSVDVNVAFNNAFQFSFRLHRTVSVNLRNAFIFKIFKII